MNSGIETMITITFNRQQNINCESENILPVRILDTKEYKQLLPCRTFEFFLPGNVSRYVDNSEFKFKYITSAEFLQQTNITEQKRGLLITIDLFLQWNNLMTV